MDDQDNTWGGGGGAEQWGLTHMGTRRGRWWTKSMWRGVGSKNCKTAPQQPAQPQFANYWAPPMRKRHHKEHGLQRPTERSDATQHAEEEPVTVQGPVKKQQPDGMSHGGGRGEEPQQLGPART